MIKKYIKGIFSLLILVVLILACSGLKTQVPNTQTKDQVKSAKGTRPNIIVVMADDLGYADVGFNGSTDIITPELDKLANAGTICTSAYVLHPFCGPSRAGFLTGRYPHTFGSQFNLPAGSAEKVGTGIPLSEKFMSKALQETGYYTGLVGKWHLGAVPGFEPNDRGFDDFYGFTGGGHMYFPNDYRPKYERQVKAGNKNIWEYLLPLEHNGVEVKETEYVTDGLSREAVRFVNEASKKDNPFFLFLSYNAPHTPLEAKKEDMEVFASIKDESRRTYAGMVYAVDRGVGEVVKTLKANNQFDNTLIIFLSDNGGRSDKGANNTPLRGNKGDAWEGGFRVPMFMHWPDYVPAGKRYDHPISALDLYPTFVDLAGGKLPEGNKLEGKNIWNDFVAGKSARPGEPIFAMRHRNGFSDIGVRQDEWKAVKAYKSKWKLHNINDDIGEKKDLKDQYPDQLKSMVEKAEAWSKTHTKPLWFDPQKLGEIWDEKNMGAFEDHFKVN